MAAPLPRRLVALALVAPLAAGCSLLAARPYPRDDRCNTLLPPIVDAALGAAMLSSAIDSSRAPVRADCLDSDLTCYTTRANRQSDVQAFGLLTAFFAGSAAWGLYARAQCQAELLPRLEPPFAPPGLPPPAEEEAPARPELPVPPEPAAPEFEPVPEAAGRPAY